MTIEDFIAKAQKYDSSNAFGVGNLEVDFIPDILKGFYTTCNPLNVEVPSKKFGNIHFFPFNKIKTAYLDYGFFNAGTIIFASANGDPFFVIENKIYTTYESQYLPEYVASSFEEFLSFIKI